MMDFNAANLLDRIRQVVELARKSELGPREADRLQAEMLIMEREIPELFDRIKQLEVQIPAIITAEGDVFEKAVKQHQRQLVVWAVLFGVLGLVIGAGIMWMIANVGRRFETVVFIASGAILGTVWLMGAGVRRLWRKSQLSGSDLDS